MLFFKRKHAAKKSTNPEIIYVPQSPENYRINYRFIPSTQSYEVNDLERAFFEELSKQFGQMGLFKSMLEYKCDESDKKAPKRSREGKNTGIAFSGIG